LTIIFEDYKNHSLIPINSLPFYESNQIVPPRENKEEKEKEVILICPFLPPNDKSTTTLSSNKSMVSASENPNI